ncbi:hypothetical protein CCACVL1_02246 [Corchorus capsularis]|uniref:Frigida-like protein n=1 Tax=Corchorus capsularis TaxID=210143 RepID=A0A1R3K9R3_COCAP|nr:hypothetical protein CCACVL1_02246 [Corchorus capsularis]
MKQQGSKLEEEIERRERLVIQRFEEIRAKEEESERKCRDLELVKKGYDESLKQNQVEELKQREEWGLKGGFEKLCQDFELEKKDFEECCKKLEFSLKQCKQQFRKYEQQRIELKSTEKLLKDKLEEVERKEEEVGLKENSFEKLCQDFELEKKGFEERYREVKCRVLCYCILHLEEGQQQGVILSLFRSFVWRNDI